MDINKAALAFSMQEPFYGIILSSMDKVEYPKMDTMAVGKVGNVFKLFYNKAFTDSLGFDELLECLKHEVLHLCFHHFSIWDDPEGFVPDENERELRNIAADLEVNCYVNDSKFKTVRPLLCKDFGFDVRLGARKYYELIKNDKQKFQQMMESIGAGQKVGDHSMWPSLSKEEAEVVDQAMDELAAFAAEETVKSRGSIPAEMVGRIEQIKKKPKPVCDWKRYIRRYIGNEFTEEIRKSKKRESRRFPDAAGNRFKRKSHIMVAIDTSGSVSMPELIEFFGQIRTLRDRATFRVVECDARIQFEYDYKYKENTKLHGGGGTDFKPVIDKFISERSKYDALVYFTDGEAPIPANTPKDTLWVISSKGDHNKEKYRVNGASVVIIPKKQ